MLVEKDKKLVTIISLAILLLIISSTSFVLLPKGLESYSSFSHMLSMKQQPPFSNQSIPIELGFGPSSLVSVSQQIPVYTVNDEFWIESNYNNTIRVNLQESNGTVIQTTLIPPNTITDFFSFNSSLVTQNFTLLIIANCSTGCQFYSYPVQFVNTKDNTIGSLASHYTISNTTLSISLSSPDLANKFDIEQCLSNLNSDSEVVIPLPNNFGSGFIGIVGDPYTEGATIILGGAFPSTPFAFSFELLGNYTSVIANGNKSNVNYISSELEVARSDSILVQRSGQSNNSIIFSLLAPLRSGRYILRATFQNSNGLVLVNTPLLVTSPFSSTWFWLGGCLDLSEVSPTFTSQTNLSGSPVSWPRYLYLMFQSIPGIEGYANLSLVLPLDRVRFVSGSNASLPPNIGLSYIQNKSDPSAIEDVVVAPDGIVYLVTNGTYPIQVSFALTFGGVIFNRSSIFLGSPYGEVLENVKLSSLEILATENGKGLANASVTIHSGSLNSSVTIFTNVNGIVQTLVPQGNYTIYVSTGGRTEQSAQYYFVSGSSYSIPVIFSGPVDYTSYLTWTILAITIFGVVGNLWFWLAKRRIRSTLK